LEAWWITLLREQQSDGFPDVAGTVASATVPIADQLISRVIAARIPPAVPIREFALVAHAGDEITVRIRLTKTAILPWIQLRLAIVQQPELPSSPIIVFGIVSRGLATSLAVNALRFVDVLPPGVGFDGGRFVIDLRSILERQNTAEALAYLTDLKITTVDRRVVVHLRAGVPGR
jgi:hypothetical protein